MTTEWTAGLSKAMTTTMALASKLATAMRLARRGMARCARQSWIAGPKRGCASNHAEKRGDPRAAANPPASTNGVVGNRGRINPSMPMPTQVPASKSQNVRMNAAQGTWLPRAGN